MRTLLLAYALAVIFGVGGLLMGVHPGAAALIAASLAVAFAVAAAGLRDG